ncbi:unnamed protein product [Phaeothamnion confervicola]
MIVDRQGELTRVDGRVCDRNELFKGRQAKEGAGRKRGRENGIAKPVKERIQRKTRTFHPICAPRPAHHASPPVAAQSKAAAAPASASGSSITSSGIR